MLTNNPVILSWITGYEIVLSSSVTQFTIPVEPTYSQFECNAYKECIKNLLTIGAISPCEHCEGQYISTTFLIPKPDGQQRFILNLKQLNKHITTQHFKLEDLRTSLKLISQDCYMATIDLKDAYFLVNIHQNSRKYLRFYWSGQLYQFNVLPFGLNTAPFVFTKILKPVAKLLRSMGYLSTFYLDDLHLVGHSYKECLDNMKHTKCLLQSLGFIINTVKSSKEPSRTCKFLGNIIDSTKLEVRLPENKKEKIKRELIKFKSLNKCKIRDFARFLGLLTSACQAVEYGWLYTKDLERCKYLNLKDDENYDKFMTIPKSLNPTFNWWLDNIDNAVCKIKSDEYAMEIYTDASTTGWGAACGGNTANGPWDEHERSLHINYLEILAAFLGLKVFAQNLYNCQILLRVDNTTAISYINRMGGVQFPHLTNITKQLWQWCETHRTTVCADYIKSSDNIVADAESRKSHPDIEWEISNQAFNTITNHFGIPSIDLFASRINHKCNKYVSWHRDPDAYAINAFTLPWTNLFFYAFPPISVILKTLRKIINDRATGIVVVPKWPTQPWYPLFKSLLTSKPLVIHSRDDLIISHCSDRALHRRITLVVGLLSGQRSYEEESHHPLSQ